MIIVIDIALYRSGVTYIQLYIDFYKGLYTMKQHLVMPLVMSPEHLIIITPSQNKISYSLTHLMQLQDRK